MAIAPLLLLGSTALSATSSVMAGQQAKAAGQAQKDIAEYNARQLDRQAQARGEAAALEDTRIARQSRIALGAQIAQGGKSGTVSDVDALADTAYQFAMDRNLSMRQGLVESQGLRGQADMQRSQGQYAYDLGKRKRDGSYVKAGASILAGAYSAYGAMTPSSGASLSNYNAAQSTGFGRSNFNFSAFGDK